MASEIPLLTVNNTMPRALLISEIFSNVISHIGTHEMDEDHRDGPTALSRRTLLSLASTCRAFSEQALDALWETSTDIDLLLQCAGIILADNDDGVIPTESQLAIINRYAHRIRFLTMGNDKWSRRVQSFLQTFAYSSKVLMPNLRGLVVGTDSLFHLVPPLLGPRLQHLTIQTTYYEDSEAHVLRKPALDMFLRSLPSSCPSIQSFKVDIDTGRRALDVPSIAPLLSHPIQNLQQLRTVIAPSITKDTLTHLPTSLTSIETYLPTGSDLEEILGSSHGQLVFKNLGSVDWWIKEWRDVEDFARLWPGKLTSLSLRCSPVGFDQELRSDTIEFDPDLLQVFFGSLHTRDAFRYLQCIRLSESSNYPREFESTTVITLDTIRPLFHLTRLRVVDIDTTCSISLCEEDLEEVAAAWPCLEVLLLNKELGWHAPTPLMTVVVVVRFIELCPCLTELCIGITLDNVDEEFDHLKPCNSDTLEYLTLRYPHADEHCLRVAHSPGSVLGKRRRTQFDFLLEKLFPRVKPFCEVTEDYYF
ncbi:hypothetical protein DFH29DRAFT_1082930 [Suillus ampliporus]|nr:hypothetical protein DFH29DRAFT_1082930 [Suillus ampliporus]